MKNCIVDLLIDFRVNPWLTIAENIWMLIFLFQNILLTFGLYLIHTMKYLCSFLLITYLNTWFTWHPSLYFMCSHSYHVLLLLWPIRTPCCCFFTSGKNEAMLVDNVKYTVNCSKFEVLSYLTKFVSLPCLADGDPHFVVDFPLSKLTVCFNINGEPGDVLRLVTDHKHSGKPRAWIISLIIIFCTIQAFLNILSKYNDLQFQ